MCVCLGQANKGMDPLEFMYDYLLSGGILWKPQVGLYPEGNMCATPATSPRPVYPSDIKPLCRA